MIKLLGTGLLGLVVGLATAAHAGTAPETTPQPAEARWRSVTLPLTWITFDVAPVRGADVVTQSFPSRRGDQVAESVSLRVVATERVRLDVWGSAGRLDLPTWFARRFGKELDGHEALSMERAGVRSLPAMRVARPPGCGVPPRELVVVRLGDAVAVVSLLDASDPDAVALFDALLATLDQVGGEVLR